MAIMRNLNLLEGASGRAAAPDGGPFTARAISEVPERPAPAAPLLQPAVPLTAAPLAIRPEIIARMPEIVPRIPPIIRELPPLLLPKTTTQLARGAINQLVGANPAVVREAISTIRNKNVAGARLMSYLERKTKIGEVLNAMAKDWSQETKQDFADSFQMAADKLEVMDSIVSVAILNDPDLEEELTIENTPGATEKDLLENRRIVWQYPPPGTPLDPPYLVLVAVEHRDVAKAEEVVRSILGELVDFEGYKIPKAAAQKLR